MSIKSESKAKFRELVNPKSAKILVAVALSLPVFVLTYVLLIQPLGRLALAPQQCQLKKWNLPQAAKQVKSQPNISKRRPVLVARPHVTCCEGDASCLDNQIWGENEPIKDSIGLIASIDQSLKYLQSPQAQAAYQNYPVAGITRARVIASLQRFRQLVQTSKSAKQLNAAIKNEFVLYQSIGHDKKGGVLFTSYYEPIYEASRTRTAEFRYPIYREPPDLDSWPRPHPKRVDLEGADGLQASKSKLRGLEIFWFRDRLEPYMMQIQGSARLHLTDGTETTVGYAASIAQNYKSIGKALADDGKLPLEGMTMPKILDYFHKYPQELNIYIPRDPSFVFFKENHGVTATGSTQATLTTDRSIATDKSLMPPGALALIRAYLPFPNTQGQMEHRVVSRYVLDQDAGGAIKGAGRVDYFVGAGLVAAERAGVTVGHGQLFYLMLKPKS
ncbi:murein transglycosylase [Dulcicalothrix desertica PCC 7102]|uniref:peptidoglycan lytic exotransglycosylase n=1 Tax=Dulcicalothrix desertica PCC 7102 TaxID=232991 RepID=A0A3S1BA75_9CYAN|nr:MltA domain-containing protein [Dulcicalothrix desertica]RUT07897.1 murein transglycosylase [Dulcicalothrix desertica PCC 7102]TWH39418.1 membrane-bound lytic murein transglycosylase A [Dulcicalothrix desertica PCC 7102]